MNKAGRQESVPLMVLPDGYRVKDQHCLTGLVLHQRKGNKAGNADNDIGDA